MRAPPGSAATSKSWPALPYLGILLVAWICPGLAVALWRGHDSRGTQKRISIRSCSSSPNRFIGANGRSGTPICLPAIRRSPIRNR